MRLALVLVLTSGCFSSWAVTQAVGGQRVLDERTRTERVPLDDARERMHVLMPFAATQPYAFECRTTQTATDEVHRSGFRYGATWKKVAFAMFALEAGAAAAIYFAADLEKPENVAWAGFFAADALGTAVIGFAPRKELYRRDAVPVHTSIRTDCPDGIRVELGAETFALDATGRIGELGDAALETWRRDLSAPPARVIYGDRALDVRIGMSATFEVPLGALTSLAE